LPIRNRRYHGIVGSHVTSAFVTCYDKSVLGHNQIYKLQLPSTGKSK